MMAVSKLVVKRGGFTVYMVLFFSLNAARKTWHNVSMHHVGVNGPLK